MGHSFEFKGATFLNQPVWGAVASFGQKDVWAINDI